MTSAPSSSHGYEMSPHVSKLLDAGDEQRAVKALIADIFTQRLRSHHRAAMETGPFSDNLEQFVQRAPARIEVAALSTPGTAFSIEKIQTITDDLVTLDTYIFGDRYSLTPLISALEQAETAPPTLDETETEVSDTSPDWSFYEWGGGREVCVTYQALIEQRIEQWDALIRKITIFPLLIVLPLGFAAPYLEPTIGLGSAIYLLILLPILAIGLIMATGMGLPLRWMPEPVLRRWFGPLPAEAVQFRDFLLQKMHG